MGKSDQIERKKKEKKSLLQKDMLFSLLILHKKWKKWKKKRSV